MNADPLLALRADRTRAQELGDDNAGLCTVASVDEQGEPQIRTVVLRDLQARFALFINATSPKQRQFNRGTVAVCVYLPSIQVQYRLACALEAINANIVQESWQYRPDPPKRMDWYYMQGRTQSSTIEDRQTLLEEVAAVALPEPLTAPTSAVGYWLQPTTVDRLDLAQENGIHDRVAWHIAGDKWARNVVVP